MENNKHWTLWHCVAFEFWFGNINSHRMPHKSNFKRNFCCQIMCSIFAFMVLACSTRAEPTNVIYARWTLNVFVFTCEHRTRVNNTTNHIILFRDYYNMNRWERTLSNGQLWHMFLISSIATNLPTQCNAEQIDKFSFVHSINMNRKKAGSNCLPYRITKFTHTIKWHRIK